MKSKLTLTHLTIARQVMSTHPLDENPLRIEEFLDGRLAADQSRQIELHLDNCATCRSRLESAAADESYWREVATHLTDDALDHDFRVSGSSATDSLSPFAREERPELLRITDYFDPTDDPRMLGRFGGYEIAGIVGSGGMGVVLKGFEAPLDRYVAIKVLAPHLAMSGAARSRFAREARAAAAVLHENVVSIHRVAEANGLPFLVMPYIPGDSLLKRLDERGPLALDETLRIGMQIAAGLAAAHAQGLVHRDIKPGNILLDSGVERVTITDFGLARAADDASLTRSGVISGTPQFMSPEQARGEPVDARSDLFSLGSVLYAMCTGRPPFRADTPYGVLRRISEADPRPIREIAPAAPEWLAEIIEKLHAKTLDDRYQSAGEVADVLGRWLLHLQQPATTPAPPRPLRRATPTLRPRRFRRWAVAAAAVVGALAVLLVATQLQFFGAGDSSVEKQTTVTDRSTTAEQITVPESIPDERELVSEYRQVRERTSQFERQWSSSPPTVNSLDRDISDLGKQIEEFATRIEQTAP
jgi:serine/threonine-protein kinase